MKIVSWEKFDDEEDDDTSIEGLPQEILSPIKGFNPNVNAYEDFNFFIGHCNFYINSEMVNTLCQIEGIEALDILSPYRFRVAVGKLFAPQEILDNIESILTKE